MSRKIYVFASYFEGESCTAYSSLTEEQIKKIEEIVGSDFFDDITYEHSAEIKLITVSEHVDSLLAGESMNGYYDKDIQIRAVLDEENGFEADELEDVKARYPKEYESAMKYKNAEEMSEARDNE